MKPIKEVSLDEVRQVWVDAGREQAEFDALMAAEKKRIAKAAVSVARKKIIIQIENRMMDYNSCSKNDGCKQRAQGLAVALIDLTEEK